MAAIWESSGKSAGLSRRVMAPVAGLDLVLDLGGGDDELDAELALQALADDVHVQDAQEAGAEAEAEGPTTSQVGR